MPETAQEADVIELRRARGGVIHVRLAAPKMGGKCWLLNEKGIFVLECGEGVLRTIACTHAGGLEAIDGIPNDDGFFPDESMEKPDPRNFADRAAYLAAEEKWGSRNGRPFYSANPIVMGSWMLDGGFRHGLTIRAHGGHPSAFGIASIVWMPVPQRVLDDAKRRREAAENNLG